MTRFERFVLSHAVQLLDLDLPDRTAERIINICERFLDISHGCGRIGLDGGPGSGNFAPDHTGIIGSRGGSQGKGGTFAEGGGKTERCRGFASVEAEQTHYDKHAGEFSGRFSTIEEYTDAGTAFLAQACEGDIAGYTCADGRVVRFNTKTTEYAAGYPEDGILCTYMLPKVSRTGKIRTSKAKKYYESRKEKDRAESEKDPDVEEKEKKK